MGWGKLCLIVVFSAQPPSSTFFLTGAVFQYENYCQQVRIIMVLTGCVQNRENHVTVLLEGDHKNWGLILLSYKLIMEGFLKDSGI